MQFAVYFSLSVGSRKYPKENNKVFAEFQSFLSQIFYTLINYYHMNSLSLCKFQSAVSKFIQVANIMD